MGAKAPDAGSPTVTSAGWLAGGAEGVDPFVEWTTPFTAHFASGPVFRRAVDHIRALGALTWRRPRVDAEFLPHELAAAMRTDADLLGTCDADRVGFVHTFMTRFATVFAPAAGPNAECVHTLYLYYRMAQEGMLRPDSWYLVLLACMITAYRVAVDEPWGLTAVVRKLVCRPTNSAMCADGGHTEWTWVMCWRQWLVGMLSVVAKTADYRLCPTERGMARFATFLSTNGVDVPAYA